MVFIPYEFRVPEMQNMAVLLLVGDLTEADWGHPPKRMLESQIICIAGPFLVQRGHNIADDHLAP